jgi:hypothetical protein
MNTVEGGGVTVMVRDRDGWRCVVVVVLSRFKKQEVID